MTDYKYPLHPYHEIKDLKDMLDQSARSFPDHVAFLTKPEAGKPYVPVSYRQFADDVEALATQLLTMGLEPQSRIAILAETRYEWYVSYLAGINSGMVMVPLDIELQDQELLSLFNRSASEAIITSSKFADRVKDLAPQIPSLKDLILIDNMAQALDPKGKANQEEEDQGLTGQDGHQIAFHLWNHLLFQGRQAVEEGNQAYRQIDLDPKELAVLLFTSGTTDKSKCVMHSDRVRIVGVNSKIER
jgi:long-chain acyl-CoA synthetase